MIESGLPFSTAASGQGCRLGTAPPRGGHVLFESEVRQQLGREVGPAADFRCDRRSRGRSQGLAHLGSAVCECTSLLGASRALVRREEKADEVGGVRSQPARAGWGSSVSWTGVV